MRATCSQKELSRALSFTASNSDFACVFVSAAGGEVELSFADAGALFAFKLKADVESEGAVNLPAKMFSKFVRGLPGGNVVLNAPADSNTVSVSCEGMETKMKSHGCFPPYIPDLGTAEIEFWAKAADLRRAIQSVVFAARATDKHGGDVLSGVEMAVDNCALSLAATDGYRLAVGRLKIDASAAGAHRVMLGAPVLKRISGVATLPGEVCIGISGKGASFLHDSFSVVATAMPGAFPRYEDIVNREHTTRAIVSRNSLLSVCTSATLPKKAERFFRFEFSGDGVVVVPLDDAHLVGETKIDATVEGPRVEVTLDASLLADGLRAITEKTVTMSVSSQKAAILVRPRDGSDYVYAIAPAVMRATGGWVV